MANYSKKKSNKDSKDKGNKKSPNEPVVGTSNTATFPRPSPTEPPVLADRDLRLGRATWNKYVLPCHDFGKVLFKELLQTYPAYELFFTHMIKSQKMELFDTPNFKTHATQRVMTKMKDMMEALDKPEELNDMMTKLGLYHVKLGVTRKHIENMQRVTVNAVRVVMNMNNKQMQFDEEESLNKCLIYAFNIAIKAAEEYLQNSTPQDAQAAARILAPSTSKSRLIK